MALGRLGIPIWREGLVGLEHAALLRDPVLRGRGVPHGDGAPVLLVPGFLAGDPTLTTMARWLRGIGYRPCRAEIRANIDCTSRTLDRLEANLERQAGRHGRAVAVVGQSRGGSLAKLLATRRPDLVDRVVTLGSPLNDHFAIHPLVRAQVTLLGLLGTLGVPGLFGRGCQDGACCEDVRALDEAPFPADIPLVSIYSRTDGIVDWRACRHPDAEHVEVRATHVGMAVNAAVYREIATVLAAGAPAVVATAA